LSTLVLDVDTHPAAAEGLFGWLFNDSTGSIAAREAPSASSEAPRAERRSNKRQLEARARRRQADDDDAAPVRSRRKRDADDDLASVDRAPARSELAPKGMPLFLVVSLADQQVSVYNHDGLVTRSEVSTGMEGHETPRGIFTILERERYHASNIYSGAPMPYMQRVTWSGVAMHVGVVPGHPASHGCVRLPENFAKLLWGMTKIGERIVISPYEVAPVDFSHPALFAPKMRTELAAIGEAASPGGRSDAPEPARLNPQQYAEKLRLKAGADRSAAVRDLRDGAAAAAAKAQEARRLTQEQHAAETAATDAERRRAAAVRNTEALATAAEAKRMVSALAAGRIASVADADLARAEALRFFDSFQRAAADKDAAVASRAKAEEDLASANTRLEAARHAAADAQAGLDAAQKVVETARAAIQAASAAEKEAVRRVAPISVLISRKDRRIYVRQGFAPIFDAPIGLRDPDEPLGSHLFVASAASEDGASLKWSALSWRAPLEDVTSSIRKRPAALDSERIQLAAMGGDAAAAALDRLEIAPETRDRIAELLWVGASVIVSDQSPSAETGAVGTDLTVRLR
jgi:lipoprotein-anchoring transpeptidase ErfK/SrfK